MSGDRLDRARARVSELVASVHAAQAAREAATDAAGLRAAEAEVALRRAALEQARCDLALVERRARCDAQEAFDRDLRVLAARVLADVDAALAGALELHRVTTLAAARGLRLGTDRRPTLPREAERLLDSWRDRLRRVAAPGRRDDAA